jgi:predicted ATPase
MSLRVTFLILCHHQGLSDMISIAPELAQGLQFLCMSELNVHDTTQA